MFVLAAGALLALGCMEVSTASAQVRFEVGPGGAGVAVGQPRRDEYGRRGDYYDRREYRRERRGCRTTIIRDYRGTREVTRCR